MDFEKEYQVVIDGRQLTVVTQTGFHPYVYWCDGSECTSPQLVEAALQAIGIEGGVL